LWYVLYNINVAVTVRAHAPERIESSPANYVTIRVCVAVIAVLPLRIRFLTETAILVAAVC
jgi:hypothetical protein